MKILLITNYWYPYNASGTFRWLSFAKYIPIDILTSQKPKRGFYDETINRTGKRIFHVGSNLPACISGIVLSLYSIFFKYNVYVYSSPPETFLLGAYIQQELGRKVLIDMRDSIDRKALGFKPLKWFYGWLYKRIKNKVVSFQFLDEGAKVIRSGYENIKTTKKQAFLECSFREYYGFYLGFLSDGIVPCYLDKPRGYGSSSFVTLRHLGFENLPRHFHDEVHNCEINSWKEQSIKMLHVLETL